MYPLHSLIVDAVMGTVFPDFHISLYNWYNGLLSTISSLYFCKCRFSWQTHKWLWWDQFGFYFFLWTATCFHEL